MPKQPQGELLPPTRSRTRTVASARVSPPRGGATQARKAEAAIAALLDGGTIAQAAKKAGIGHRTLHEWLAAPWFATQYAAAKKRALDGTIRNLRAIGTATVQGLYRIACDEKATHIARVSAGRTILDALLRAVELEDVMARIDALEEAQRNGSTENFL